MSFVSAESAFSGIKVIGIEYGADDRVVYKWFYGDEVSKPTKAKIRYNAKGDPYFVSYNRRWYLGDFAHAI